jgi:hypothetical protein
MYDAIRAAMCAEPPLKLIKKRFFPPYCRKNHKEMKGDNHAQKVNFSVKNDDRSNDWGAVGGVCAK